MFLLYPYLLLYYITLRKHAVAAIAEVTMFGHKTAPINPKTINWSNARKMLETASNAGHTVSMINLAGFYMDGTKGVDIDHVKAHGLFLSVSYILLIIT